ncbi:MAG: hypothetical protein M9962_09680 [Oligoflexia bacterium]|nr:hypothetical protein [Oligoflexia bacterium]
MKTLLIMMSAFLIPVFSSFAKEGDVHEKIVPVNDVYIPNGFDSGSDVFVVVNGWFPHSCYQLKEARVDHIGSSLHEVRTIANVTEGLCLTVIVPFHKEVQLGRLNIGEHKVRFMNGDGTYMEKSLTIEQ